MADPEQLPPKLDVGIARTEMIDGDIYINLDDFINLLKIQVREYDTYAAWLITHHGLKAISVANDYVLCGTGIGHSYKALKRYSETTKFDKIVGENNEQQ